MGRKLILQTMFEMKNEISQLRKERVSQHSQQQNVNGVSVQSWLTAIGFERYHKLFTSNGIDSMHAVQSLDKGTFDALHFSKAQDKSKVWIAIQSLQSIPSNYSDH